MRLSELLRRVTPELPDFDPEITFITDDSRKVKPGCAFVCIRGNHIDGHTLAVKAVESGAAAVIAQADTGLSCQVLVPDTRAAFKITHANRPIFQNSRGLLKCSKKTCISC